MRVWIVGSLQHASCLGREEKFRPMFHDREMERFLATPWSRGGGGESICCSNNTGSPCSSLCCSLLRKQRRSRRKRAKVRRDIWPPRVLMRRRKGLRVARTCLFQPHFGDRLSPLPFAEKSTKWTSRGAVNVARRSVHQTNRVPITV